jgi:DNA polymerase-3 subunit delta'
MQSFPIVGHRPQVEALKMDLATGNVAHAYLFAGRKSLGKFTIAKWFAKELLTVDAGDERERERLSREIDRLLHKDLLVIDKLWVEDQEEDFDVLAKYSNILQQHRKKDGAKTDTISIEDIRSLQERLHEVKTGRFRCCLIREVGRLQEQAVNALLKILEEPPPGVVFLLTAESASSLLPTIVSRTRVMHFSPVATKELLPIVTGLPEEEAQFLLRVAQGAPGLIMRLKNDPDALRLERQQYGTALAFWHATSLSERLLLLSPLSQRGEEAQQLLLHLSLALREEKTEQMERRSHALHELIRGLKTNASRPLLVQRFVFAVSLPR